jgi:hypothetical protein
VGLGIFCHLWLRNMPVVARRGSVVMLTDWLLKATVHAVDFPYRLHSLSQRNFSGALVVCTVIWLAALPGVSQRALALLGVTLIYGGAIGNLGELAAVGHVTNFIPAPAGSVASPADAFVVTGIVLLCIDVGVGVVRSCEAAPPAGR